MSTVLVVDDKELMRDSVAETLRRVGMDVVTAPDAPAALAAIAQRRPDCVVSDLKMPGMTGVDLLERIRAIDEDLPLILMTAFGTVETAVKAMRLGAYDYLTKPFEGDELIIAVKRAIEHARVRRENQILRASVVEGSEALAVAPADPGVRTGTHRLIGSGAAMNALRAHVRQVAKSQGTVLVTGPSGAGKEVIARAIHEESARASGPFLAVNCAALSESVLESELFGHERGAFTGADKTRKGRFELADGGTLLLDEISEVSPKVQAKLLRVLQERQFERVGSSQSIGVDVRVVATSNRDLPAECEKGNFRGDLYYRLNVLPVQAPALRERREDIPELATHFVGKVCEREGRGPIRFDIDAMDLLRRYGWPGNVRELQNICERAVVIAGDRDTIGADLVGPWLPATARSIAVPILPENVGIHTPSPVAMVEAKPSAETSARTLEEIERDTIVQALQRFSGHRQRTAHALGIGVRTLGLKLKRWKEQRLVSDAL